METSPVHPIPPKDLEFCSCCDGGGTIAESYFVIGPKFTGVVFTGKQKRCPDCYGTGTNERAKWWRKQQLERRCRNGTA